MKTKAKAKVAPPVTALGTSARSKIVAAIRGGADAIGRSGTIITSVCVAANSVADGVALSATDTDAIMSEVAKSSAIASMKPQTKKTVLSRWRTVLSVYSLIPEAEKALRSKLGCASWHDVMTLAVRLKSNGGDVPAAVSSVVKFRESKPGAKKITTKTDAMKVAKDAVKRILRLPRMEKEFFRKLEALCVEFEILGAK